jgi:hypothetical protein
MGNAQENEAADVISIEDNMYLEDEAEGRSAMIIQGEQEPDTGPRHPWKH